MATRCVFFASRCLRDSLKLYHSGPVCNRLAVSVFSTAAEQHNAGDDSQGDDTNDARHSVTNVRQLEVRASKLEEQVRDLTEQYKRALADSDNVRRRTQKFVEDAKLFGIQSFCRDLVEVVDLLEQTVRKGEGQGADHEEAQDRGQSKQTDSQETLRGMEVVQGRLLEVFSKHGLKKMEPVGNTYDPYQHEIVCRMPAEGVEPGTITVVKQNGYTLHGRTIRHAHVGVAVKTQE